MVGRYVKMSDLEMFPIHIGHIGYFKFCNPPYYLANLLSLVGYIQLLAMIFCPMTCKIPFYYSLHFYYACLFVIWSRHSNA